MAAPFITTTDLGVHLHATGSELATIEADLAAQQAVEMACGVCRTLAEQEFTAQSGLTVTLDGTGTDAVLLPELPVQRVSSVSTVATDGTATALATTDYRLNGRGVLLKAAGVWPKGRQNVAVKYNAGYGTTDIPDDVKAVALAVASRLYNQGIAVFETVNNNDHSVRYAGAYTDLQSTEKAILAKYRTAKSA